MWLEALFIIVYYRRITGSVVESDDVGAFHSLIDRSIGAGAVRIQRSGNTCSVPDANHFSRSMYLVGDPCSKRCVDRGRRHGAGDGVGVETTRDLATVDIELEWMFT